jgi:hypothetical protein
MKAKKSHGKPAAKRVTKDLPPKKTSDVKGGTSWLEALAKAQGEVANTQAQKVATTKP